jgi:cytochrome bd ubiquinol oxidase subunit I
MLMVLLGLWAGWARLRRQLYRSRLLLRFVVLMGPAGLIAILAGWFTTELGRQPWVVYGVMRTSDAVSNHSLQELSATLAIFVVVYCTVFGTGISYMIKLVARGPDASLSQAEEILHRRAVRLFAAPDDVDPAVDLVKD